MSLTETRAAPLHLWREAETLLQQLFTLFGEPPQIAFQHTLTAKAHKLLAQWLRGAEALLRQLLLIEAAALGPPAPSPARAAGGAPMVQEKRFIEHHPDQPEHWRVSFRCLFSSPVYGGNVSVRSALTEGAARARRNESRFLSAWPLAERAEALLRVFNNPVPYAKRLARKLFAHPGRAALIIEGSARDEVLPRDMSEDARTHAAAAWRKLQDSS